MSAFLCSDRHIKAIAAAAVRGHDAPIGAGELCRIARDHDEVVEHIEDQYARADAIARILLRENVRSLEARYGDKCDECGIAYSDHTAAGLMKHCGQTSIERDELHEKHEPVQVIKLCNCFDYQACESDDYERTLAADIVRRVRERQIMELPGYDDAKWCID